MHWADKNKKLTTLLETTEEKRVKIIQKEHYRDNLSAGKDKKHIAALANLKIKIDDEILYSVRAKEEFLKSRLEKNYHFKVSPNYSMYFHKVDENYIKEEFSSSIAFIRRLPCVKFYYNKIHLFTLEPKNNLHDPRYFNDYLNNNQDALKLIKNSIDDLIDVLINFYK